MNRAKQRQGFTLVELMLTMVAASVVFATVALILMMAFWSWRANNATVAMRRNLALATDMIARKVRESSYEGITCGDEVLTVQSAVNMSTVSYTQIGETLAYVSGADSMLLIPDSLLAFSADKQNDGIELMLALENSDFSISVTNKMFINTRN